MNPPTHLEAIDTSSCSFHFLFHNPNETLIYYGSFHFLIHYPNTTPIYYSSFHFLFQYPNITQCNSNILYIIDGPTFGAGWQLFPGPSQPRAQIVINQCKLLSIQVREGELSEPSWHWICGSNFIPSLATYPATRKTSITTKLILVSACKHTSGLE